METSGSARSVEASECCDEELAGIWVSLGRIKGYGSSKLGCVAYDAEGLALHRSSDPQ